MTAIAWPDHEARLEAGQACLDAALNIYLPLGLSVTCCCDPDHIGVDKHANTCDTPGKAPMHKWKYLQERLPTEEEVRAEWRKFPYGNVGCVLGQVSGLVRVDIDGPEGEALLAEWSAGDLPLTWAFRSSPEGRGLLYGWPRDLPCKSTAKAQPGEHKELRLMASGSQTVLPPSRHPSGRPYAWEPGCNPTDVGLAPAPAWLVERLRQEPKQHAPRQTTSVHASLDYARVQSALAAIPNDDAAYDDWLTLGMALHSTGEAWARGLWDAWSQQSGKYDEGKQEKAWASFTPDGLVQIGSLFHVAQEHGWKPLRTHLHANGTRPVPDMTGSTPAQSQEQPDPIATAQQTAATLLQTLPTLADDAQKEDAILEALPTLAPLDTIAWMPLKRQLKTAVPSLNLNDLERARNDLRRTTAQAAGHTAGSAQAQIAAQLAHDYAGTLAYDLSRQAWMTYGHGLWQPIEVERVWQRIGAYMDEALHGDYTWPELSGVEHLLRTRLAHLVTRTTPGWLPFQNGALCLKTMTLHPHSPERPFTWQLPHAYDPQATCPQTIAWLHEAVGQAHDQVQVLRAYAKAVVTGRVDLQRYLEVLGPGGTGKGTYTRLLQALVGSENTFVTELKHLETNRFELSNLHGKVLMLITDAERYGGPVNQLKAITGQDFVRMEEKFKAQRTEIAPVMVMIAANEPIQSADYTSGLVRRRLSMYFRHRPTTPRDLLTWKEGAWHGELAREIPGVLNWILALPDAAMETLLQQTTEVVPSLQRAWAYSLVDTNPLADWSNQALILDAHTDATGRVPAVNVGKAVPLDHTHGFEHEETWLYPNYRAWVDATGGKPLSSRRFTGLLKDLFENQLRLDGVEHTDDMYGSRFHGIRLRTYSDKDEPLFITRDPTPMTDMTPPMTPETRAHDGYDACDGFLQTLYRHPPPLPSDPAPPPRGVGVSIGDFSNNPSLVSYPSLPRESSVMETSYPSLARGNGCHTTPVPSVEPLPEVAKASPMLIPPSDVEDGDDEVVI